MYNAESPTPMQVYISPTTSTNVKASEDNWGMYTIHLMRRSGCFVFDLSWNLRDSYSVKTKAYKNAFYNMYVYPTFCPRGLSAWIWHGKDRPFTIIYQEKNNIFYHHHYFFVLQAINNSAVQWQDKKRGNQREGPQVISRHSPHRAGYVCICPSRQLTRKRRSRARVKAV